MKYETYLLICLTSLVLWSKSRLSQEPLGTAAQI